MTPWTKEVSPPPPSHKGAKDTILPRFRVTSNCRQKKDWIPLKAGNSQQHLSCTWSTTHISLWPYFWAPYLTVELPAYTRINNLHAPGRQMLNQVLRTQSTANKKKIAVLGEKGLITNGYPKFPRIWSWKGRDNVEFCLPLLIGGWQRSQRANSGKNSHPRIPPAGLEEVG